MLVPMLTPAPGRRRPAPTALLAVADNMSEAMAAVRAGADLVDLGGAQRPAVAEFRARHLASVSARPMRQLIWSGTRPWRSPPARC